MMQERWLVIGADQRMKMLATKLSDTSRTVYYKSTSVWDEGMNDLSRNFEPHHIIMPIQPLKVEANEIYGIKDATFYVGKLNQEWEGILAERTVLHYLEQELFIWKNASLTAEAMLAHILQNGHSIKGKRILITGFGRVAKMLAQVFTQIQAQVAIAVRSEVQLAEASAYGYEVFDLAPDVKIEMDMIINTIPTKWLTPAFISIEQKPFYDVASAPGCLNEKKLDNYELLPALPGKYFPQDAAGLLYDAILQLRQEV